MNTTTHTTGKIFKNPFPEKLTKSNPISIITFYVLMITCYLFLSYTYTKNSLSSTIELYISGLFIWSFMEYVLHRWAFHIDEYLPFKFAKHFHYVIHGIHHENPKDAERLLMPPMSGVITSFLLYVFWYLFLKLNALSFMAGLINGYLFYWFIHYTIHAKPIQPKFRKLCTHHEYETRHLEYLAHYGILFLIQCHLIASLTNITNYTSSISLPTLLNLNTLFSTSFFIIIS